MKKIIIVLTLFFNINTAVASTNLPSASGAFLTEEQDEIRNGHSQPLFYYDDKPIRLPIIDYQMLKEQDLMTQQWGIFTDANRQRWHLHWALESRGDFETFFPPSHYNYKVVLENARGIGNDPDLDSKFATYILHPFSIQNPQDRAPNLYTFFLSLPACCKMHHY